MEKNRRDVKGKLKGHYHTTMACLLSKACFLLVSLLLLSCNSHSGYFSIKGEFKGFNQGQFYVYSPDGGTKRMDTVAVKNGQFFYNVPLDTTATFVLVFPNYSEIPVFGASGEEVELEGDASHLKEIMVYGTDENELMTTFRLKISEMTPPQITNAASDFIQKNPGTLAAIYVLTKYFIQTEPDDYQLTFALAKDIQKALPNNKNIARIVRDLEGMKNLRNKSLIPKFTATDIKGKPVSNQDLYAQVNVITTWAIWNYESMNIQRQLKRMEKDNGASKLKIVSFCLDASDKDCKTFMDRDSITWSNICDGKMWETPALIKLGLTKVPDNIVTDSKGRIIAHSLPVQKLREEIDKLMK
jgi:hypothetical protein